MKKKLILMMVVIAGMVLAMGGSATATAPIHYWNFDMASGSGTPVVPNGTTSHDVSFPDLGTGTAAPMVPVSNNATSYGVIAGHNGAAGNYAVQISGSSAGASGAFTTAPDATPIKSVPTDFTFVGWVRWDSQYNANNGQMTQRNGPMDIYNNPGSSFAVAANGIGLPGGTGSWTKTSGGLYFVTVTGDKSGAQKLTGSVTSVGQTNLGDKVNFINVA